jgi:hypothetical protein
VKEAYGLLVSGLQEGLMPSDQYRTGGSMRRVAVLFLAVLAGLLPAWSQTHIPGNAIPSSKHYRESGVGNATGRTGGATMTARALLAKDGTALVEVTTGTLDSSATPPGSFAKVQFKPLDPNGNALLATNFTPLAASGGYYGFSWPSLYRGEQIQLQGNITGIDKNRTDVVTVVETTKLRPDLAVQSLTFPGSAAVNHPVNISANVVEMNGDASATATCVLNIDGSDVDQVKNVYVDAGGSVSCGFAYTFTTTGNHTVQITAADVVPGDWDSSNNSASSSISITSPDVALGGSGSFYDQKGSFPRIGTSSEEEWYGGSLVFNTSNTYGDSGEAQNSYAYFASGGCAGSAEGLPLQFPISINYLETMDGTSVYSFTNTVATSNTTLGSSNFPLCNSTATSMTQQYGSTFASDHWEYADSYQYYDAASKPLAAYNVIQIYRYAGDVTYFSYGYQCDWWQDCSNSADYYAWNYSGHNSYGTLIPLGSAWTPSVAIQDAAGNHFSGTVSVPLTSSTFTASIPDTCYDYGPDLNGLTYHYCWGSNYDYTVTTSPDYNNGGSL